MIGMYALIFISAVAQVMVLLFLISAARNIVTSSAPFVPVPDEVVADIVKELSIRRGDAVYDLGCGDARVLIAAARAHPDASYTGIDRDLFALIVAQARRIYFGYPAVKLAYGNFFKSDISHANRVFLYLFPEVMDALLPKLQAELPKGAMVVSCDFAFSKKEPARTIPLEYRKDETLGRVLHVYEF